MHMKITHMSQFIISPKQMRGLEADQSRESPGEFILQKLGWAASH